jgi:hypothetical protein
MPTQQRHISQNCVQFSRDINSRGDFLLIYAVFQNELQAFEKVFLTHPAVRGGTRSQTSRRDIDAKTDKISDPLNIVLRLEFLYPMKIVFN